MGKGGSAANDAARQARIDENNRQARIRTGTAAINNTFDGGTVGTGAIGADAVYDPTKTYYMADGSVYAPTPGRRGTILGGSGRDDGGWAEAVKAGLFSGTETRSGFGEGFFGDLRDSFVDFARPQLDDQFRKAGEQSTYALARSGTLDSSIRGEQNAELKKQYDINLQDVTDKARGYETEARTNVERARGDLVAMLEATGGWRFGTTRSGSPAFLLAWSGGFLKPRSSARRAVARKNGSRCNGMTLLATTR